MASLGPTTPTGLCPHDGTPAPHQSERYFDALCWACVERATDAAGRRVALYNADLMGGFEAVHADDHTPCGSVTQSGLVLIDGVSFQASEARFGGIVVRPVPGPRDA